MAPSETIQGTLQELLPRLQSLPATERYRLTRPPGAETSAKPFYQTATPEEWGRAWREWAASHRSQSPSLSDEAVERGSIYD